MHTVFDMVKNGRRNDLGSTTVSESPKLNNATNQSSLIPAIAWLRSYPRQWLRADVTAGLIAAAVVIPKAMAFATIAGLPVQVGLYTAFVPMVVYALLGTSRPLSVSTTTTLAILAAASLGEAVPNGDAAELVIAGATLAMLVGVMLLLASLLRLGFVANFISDPVLAGFKSGIGLVIVVDQIPKLFGFHIEKAGFFRDIFAMVQHLPQTSAVTLVLAAVMLRADLRIGTLRAARAGPADCGRGGHCRVRSAWPAGRGRGNSGQHSARPSGLGVAAARSRRADVASGSGHCVDEFHREHRSRARVCQTRGAASGAGPGVAGARHRQSRRRPFRRHAGRRRHHPDGSQSPRRRTHVRWPNWSPQRPRLRRCCCSRPSSHGCRTQCWRRWWWLIR